GHAVLNSTNVKPLIAFYRDVMQFGVSDYYDQPFVGCFFHVNPRHHSFAIFENAKDMVHHVMMEYFAMDDMGHGWDLAQANDRVAVTLGRHAGDDVLSFYTWTPSKFMIESGWGGKVIDPATWEPGERTVGPSIWGHERLWMPDAQKKIARDMMLKAAEQGYRRKVNVLDGNYKLMPGEAPDEGLYVRDSADDSGVFSDRKEAAE
ncbi:MAG: VOC family protein, partial [Beijerinckiaceae bacterium]|nr:VOC family protein [Beijerinckiaceae bacterium]